MPRRRSRIHAALFLSVGAFAATSLVGCSNYRGNPTPGVKTLNVSNQQNKNRAATVTNTNIRAMRNDFTRFFLYDRPSRLTKQPSPY